MEPALDQHELDFLCAADALSKRQLELYPLLATAMGTDPYDYAMIPPGPDECGWFSRRRRERIARGRKDDWCWWFHGLQFDLHNAIDGRFVRIDFGPTTARLVVTGWGVLQYVMCAARPWGTFDQLRTHLADRGPPYDSLSGNHARMSRICDRLETLGLLVAADRQMLDLRERFTVVRPGTHSKVIDVPRELAPPGPMDLFVCGRLVVAEAGRKVLRERAPNRYS